MATATIYMPLDDEGVEVWAPVEATQLDHGMFQLPSASPSDQVWRYDAGSVVVCEEVVLDGGRVLAAVRAA